MKNKINLLTILFLIASCSVSNINNNTLTTPSSASNKSSTPTHLNSLSAMPVPTITQTPSSNQNNVNNEDNFKLLLEGEGYIYTSETAFLTLNPLDISFSLYLNEIPNSIYSIFEIYSNENKETYLSLSLDNDKNFILNFLGMEEKINYNIDLNKRLDIKILKDENKLKFSVNNNILIDKDFPVSDNKTKKILYIGANHKGENRIKAEYGYFIIKDIISYNFNKNILDDGDYKLHAISKGSYKLTPLEIISSPTPDISILPTQTQTSTPIPERNNVQTIKFSKQTIDLSVDLNAASKLNKAFYTKWYDLENRKFLENEELGDIRFYTLIENNGLKKVFLQGRLANPSTYIVDLGKVKFEGVTDITDIDFQKEQLTNKDKDKAELFNDHTYVIQTFRYGKPRYAKLFVNQIITERFDYSKMKKPEIISQPIFLDAGKITYFENNTNYKYYVSCYDGYGETEAVPTNQVSSSDTTNKKISFSFFLPYRAKGYYIYKEFGGKIYKSGPFYGEDEKVNVYEDFGNIGKGVPSIQNQNTTILSSYKETGDTPIKLEFTYSFNGEPELKTFFFE